MKGVWFPRLMKRSELISHHTTKGETTMIEKYDTSDLNYLWSQFTYRLGTAKGSLVNILDHPLSKEFFLKEGVDLRKLQKLSEAMTDVANLLYREEMKNTKHSLLD